MLGKDGFGGWGSMSQAWVCQAGSLFSIWPHLPSLRWCAVQSLSPKMPL